MREPSLRRGIVGVRIILRPLLVSFIVAASFVVNGGVFAANNEANIAARLAKLERSLEGRGLVDLLQQVETLQLEVQRLHGQIEEQTYTIEQLRKTQRETYVDIDQRLQGIEQRRGVSSELNAGANIVPPLTILTAPGSDTVAGTPAPQSSLRMEVQSDPGIVPEPDPMADDPAQLSPEVTSPTATPTVTGALPPSIVEQRTTIDNEMSDAAYRDAFSLLKAGQYEESIAAFNEFLQLYPNSQYADNAQYWLGETHYVKREFEPAVVEYRKLIETYPASKKQSHAMLKIGYSYDELGQLDQARAVLEDLRNRYAGTTAARLAEERIQRMLAENSPQ